MVHGWPTLSASVDGVFLFIAGISVLLLTGITGTMVWFAVRYRRSRHPRAENIEGNLALEILWTVLPTLLVLAIFWVGWKGFVYMRTVSADAMLVKVTGRKWSWGFLYENGRNDTVLLALESLLGGQPQLLVSLQTQGGGKGFVRAGCYPQLSC